jgi:hypothetical protein
MPRAARAADTLPVLPPRADGAPARKVLASDAADYHGRAHGVGTLSFGAACELETVSTLISSFVRAFCPRDGLRVRVSRGARSEVLPNRFAPTSSISAKQLERGGSVELTESDFEAPRRPLFWVASRAPEPAGTDPNAGAMRLSFGWCIARPGTEGAEVAVAEAMNAMVEAACDAKDCLAAFVTAQGRSLTMSASVLPYESLAGTVGRADDAEWLSRHVRSPGWRVLVPRARARALSRPPPTGVSLRRVRSGLLVCADAPTPFAMDATNDLETWLLPVTSP